MIGVGRELVAGVEGTNDEVVGTGRSDAESRACRARNEPDVGEGGVSAARGAPRDTVACEVGFGTSGPGDGAVLDGGVRKRGPK